MWAEGVGLELVARAVGWYFEFEDSKDQNRENTGVWWNRDLREVPARVSRPGILD